MPTVLEQDGPTYRRIADILGRSIEDGRLADGTVLLEGSLAAIFGSSRTPVKQALLDLNNRGLVHRFEGRGFVVGAESQPDRRLRLTPAALGLDQSNPELPKTWAWQRLYDGVERELIHRSVFGRFRVNELELARHSGVGRTVAHDVLVRAQSAGILAKDEYARWYIVPLDEKRIGDLYELREILEPAAMAGCVGRLPRQFLQQMRRRLESAMEQYPEVDAAMLDGLEHDLHIACLERGANREILEALKRTRCVLISTKHILGTHVSYPRNEPFMAEHLRIVSALESGDMKLAARNLIEHLRGAREQVIERLARFRASYAMTEVSYIG